MAFQKKTTSQKAAPKKPEAQWTVSCPTEYVRDGETLTSWSRCGMAFPLKNGEGYTILLNTLPANGKLVLMRYEPPEE